MSSFRNSQHSSTAFVSPRAPGGVSGQSKELQRRIIHSCMLVYGPFGILFELVLRSRSWEEGQRGAGGGERGEPT